MSKKQAGSSRYRFYRALRFLFAALAVFLFGGAAWTDGIQRSTLLVAGAGMLVATIIAFTLEFIARDRPARG